MRSVWHAVSAAAAAPRRAASTLSPARAPRGLAALLAAADSRAAAAEHRLADKEALLAAVECRLADKDALVTFTVAAAASAVAAAECRLADKDALVASTVAAAECRLADKQALADATSKLHAVELAAAKHAADVANSRLNVRSILETSVYETWSTCGPRKPSPAASGCAGRLMALLEPGNGCAGLVAYVRVAAVDNGVPPEHALAEARKLYATFCSRMHADAPEGSEGLSSAVFEGPGRTALVAYAALVHFSGRRLRLYMADGALGNARAELPLTMRTLRNCNATEAEICASPELED